MVELEIAIDLDTNFDDAIAKTTQAFKEHGFGVLTEIDVKKTFEVKLNVTDFERYQILGMCNPPLAKKGLDLDRRIGTLLPCNVYVQELEQNKTRVSAINPEAMFSVLNDPKFGNLVNEVKTKINLAMNALK